MLHKKGTGNDTTASVMPGAEFFFPRSGPLQPPEPPSSFTAAQLESTYSQASQLWPQISRQSCANALASHFADGDPSKAIVLIQFYIDAAHGYVTCVCKRNGSFLALRGAVNYAGVSCYADSLLVAMFSRMDNFEPLLYKKWYEDKATDLFATWLRLFVNLLRNGERITDDIVGALLAAAVGAGWTAGSNPLAQQDAADFFVFITEKLRMPLLALKVDIAHAGKEVEEYDHKLIREQLLYLPIPGNSEDPPILLEECLEVYFSNTINVSRHVPPQPFINSNHYGQSSPTTVQQLQDPFSPRNSSPRHSSVDTVVPSRHRSYSIMSLASPSLRKSRQSIDEQQQVTPQLNNDSPSQDSPSSGDGVFDPLDDSESAVFLSTPEPDSRRSSEQPHPSQSLQHLQSPHLPQHLQNLQHPQSPSSSSSTTTTTNNHPQALPGSLPSYHQLFGFNEDQQAEQQVRDIKRSLWTSNNEIMLPAWMFLQLMPFYADINRDAHLENLEADEVANHFRKTRPVLGFCLKRYCYDDEGLPKRNDRRVIVPEEINMPSFVADDSDQKQVFGSFKLVLESALFHQGTTIHSGHYVALISEDVVRARKTSGHSSAGSDSKVPWYNKSPSSSSSTAPYDVFADMPSSPRKKWYLFDDMKSDADRIREVSHTNVFENEVPYMLFYRMISLDENVDTQPTSPHPYTPQAAGLTPLQVPTPIPVSEPTSRQHSRAPSPEPGKDKKKKPKFFRRHRDKDDVNLQNNREKDKDKEKENKEREKERDKDKDYARKYREEKCIVM